MEALGKGPEVIKRVEGKWRERRSEGGGGGTGSRRSRKRKRKQQHGEESGDGREGRGRGVSGRGCVSLSTFDVKSLRQKHGGAECVSTCAGNPQC